MKFATENVKPLREKMGLTQEEFAREINVGLRTVARWEHKDSAPKIHRAIRENLIRLHKKHMTE